MNKTILFLKLNWQWIILFVWLTWISMTVSNLVDTVDYIEWQVSNRSTGRRDTSSLHSKVDNIEMTIDATYNEVLSRRN